jgi:2,5-diamino-6-(ribosylamino)-4(3H)-pyrimidinone 5'-phosphate reductase
MPRPRISTNLAISADGKISSTPPRPSGWTSRADFERLLELRKSADAILVGRGTLEADSMTMTVPESDRQPLRCVVSHDGIFDFEHPLFHKPGGRIHLLVTGPHLHQPPSDFDGQLHHGSLLEFLENLKNHHGVESLHCEGGGQLIKALAALDAIDEFHATLAGHTLFGGGKSATPTGIPGDYLPRSLDFQLAEFSPVSESGECFVTYRRKAQ